MKPISIHSFAVRIDDIGTQQHYRSHFGYSKEQAFDALELPSGVKELYYACPPVPHLSDFDKYREDYKKSMKLYTDPSYFFALWLEEQKMMMEKVHHMHFELMCMCNWRLCMRFERCNCFTKSNTDYKI